MRADPGENSAKKGQVQKKRAAPGKEGRSRKRVAPGKKGQLQKIGRLQERKKKILQRKKKS